ncbi:MAG TPA: hypothetical protein PLU33_06860 [Treponemataceae bacterium]|nr:hypothetical protein [Treponemataceae bacterium]HQL04845.1 hypothetical protein [Treponemataceae bacterium]
MNDEISPEIAALLAQSAGRPSSLPSIDSFDDFPSPDQDNLSNSAPAPDIDLSVKTFAPIVDFFSRTPNPVFNDPAYYKTALSGENDSAQKLHNILSKYLTCQDPKDRTVYRQQLVTIYWELVKSIAPKMASPSALAPKKMLLRFGVVLPTLFTPEYKDVFSSVFVHNESGEPVYYIDEWFRDIACGRVSLSATDEARPVRKSGGAGGNGEASRLMQLQSKNNGKLQNAENMISAKESERLLIESDLRAKVDQLCDHAPIPSLPNHKCCLTDIQRRSLNDINDRLKSLLRVDKELNLYIAEYNDAKEIAASLQSKLENAPTDTEVNSSDLLVEVDTVRQMAKMTVGRQGNHFPLFTKEFFHCTPRQTGFRENVIDMLAWVESLDPGAFCRVHKNHQNRIIPYVVLVPTYGDTGFCWEPFDRYNRVTSRGRIVVPMYPRNLQIAILMAVADLRWQVAKEKASYYWMEEGLTGQYYQWFSSQKLKGDLKDYFINDYILWMTKESEGVQRLEKDVRGIFWRHIPFAQEVKDKLKTRSLVYQELYQRDINRSMSDGY